VHVHEDITTKGGKTIVRKHYGAPAATGYADSAPLGEGTAFFVDKADPCLSWMWDIPILRRETSIGFVLTAGVLQERRRHGASLEDVLRQDLERHPQYIHMRDEHES